MLSSRSRTGSARAANTRARSTAWSSVRFEDSSGQQASSNTSIVDRCVVATRNLPHVLTDVDPYARVHRIDSRQSNPEDAPCHESSSP